MRAKLCCRRGVWVRQSKGGAGSEPPALLCVSLLDRHCLQHSCCPACGSAGANQGRDDAAAAARDGAPAEPGGKQRQEKETQRQLKGAAGCRGSSHGGSGAAAAGQCAGGAPPVRCCRVGKGVTG